MSNRHSLFRLKINLVVSTFQSKKMINKDIENRLIEIINKNFEKQHISLDEYKILNKSELYLSFFISPQTISLSKIVNSLKTSTSRLIKKEFFDILEPFKINKNFWAYEYKIYT